jgi:hypothetical protein
VVCGKRVKGDDLSRTRSCDRHMRFLGTYVHSGVNIRPVKRKAARILYFTYVASDAVYCSAYDLQNIAMCLAGALVPRRGIKSANVPDLHYWQAKLQVHRSTS